jgi:hypothetical protein
MTMEQEIEEAIRAGAHPLFLYGLVELASTGSADKLSKLIDKIGTKLYLRKGKA